MQYRKDRGDQRIGQNFDVALSAYDICIGAFGRLGDGRHNGADDDE